MQVVYLHGFRSTPQSHKSTVLRVAVAARAACWSAKSNSEVATHFWAPQLPASPEAAIAFVLSEIAGVDPSLLAIIGSSLGGFYATHLAEQLGCRSVLLNPAIRPYDDLRAHLGRQQVFGSAETIDMRGGYLDELLAIDTPRISGAHRTLLIAATGDEVIDWKKMAVKYAGARQRIIAGGDHALTDIAPHVDEILTFCGMP